MSADLEARDCCQSLNLSSQLVVLLFLCCTLLLGAHDGCRSESLNSKDSAASCVLVLCCMLQFAKAVRYHQSHRHVTAASQSLDSRDSVACCVLCFVSCSNMPEQRDVSSLTGTLQSDQPEVTVHLMGQ